MISEGSSGSEAKLEDEMEHAKAYFMNAITSKKKKHNKEKAKRSILNNIDRRVKELRDPQTGIAIATVRDNAEKKLKELRDFVEEIKIE